jgi:hypothetical protein
MSDELAPLETVYRGYRFRSRLEARWAVAFDTLDWTWEYEPQGFDLPNGNYLPDFSVELPWGEKRWWEIKPGRLRTDGLDCWVDLDARWLELVALSRRSLVVAFGIPGPDDAIWDVHYLHPAAPATVRVSYNHGPSTEHELTPAWRAAFAAGRAARFEHHDRDPTAEPRDDRDFAQRAAGDR